MKIYAVNVNVCIFAIFVQFCTILDRPYDDGYALVLVNQCESIDENL